MMRKILLLSILLIFSTVVIQAQDDAETLGQSEFYEEDNDTQGAIITSHIGEIWCSYMFMNEDITSNHRYTDKSSWNGIGLGLGVGLYHFDRHNCYVNGDINIGWTSDFITINALVSLNYGFDVFALSSQNLALTPHMGIGLLRADVSPLDGSKVGGYYVDSDEHINQISGCALFGAKLTYKSVFLDFVYNVRFLNSDVCIESDMVYADFLSGFIPYKATANSRSNFIKSFPWTISFGFCF